MWWMCVQVVCFYLTCTVLSCGSKLSCVCVIYFRMDPIQQPGYYSTGTRRDRESFFGGGQVGEGAGR